MEASPTTNQPGGLLRLMTPRNETPRGADRWASSGAVGRPEGSRIGTGDLVDRPEPQCWRDTAGFCISLLDIHSLMRFFSGLQQRLLAVLFCQPDRSCYGNELLRLTGTGRGALQRELEKLVSADLVTITAIGNQKHYQANPTSPIVAELCDIVLKTMGLADVLRTALNAVADRIRIAFVFRSVANGTDTATSDIDLMVVSDALSYADLFEGVATA
jgi:hypothetical protein